MSKKIITYVLTLAMIFSVFCSPALGYATTDDNTSDVTGTTALSEDADSAGDTSAKDDEPEITAPSVGTVKNLKAITVKSNYVKISWSSVAGATGYQVYRYNKATEKTKIIKTKSNSLENTKLNSDTAYTYKVRAYISKNGETYNGEFSGTITCKTKPNTGKVTGLKAKAQSHNTINVTWKKVPKATEYHVYRYNADKGKYVNIKTVKNNSFKNKGLSSSKKYYYKVMACTVRDGKCYKGKLSESVSCRTNPFVGKVKRAKGIVEDSQTIKLTWSKVSGADGYQIYRYNKQKKKYTCVDTTKKLYFTNKKLKADTNYRYKIRAYTVQEGEKFFGEFSDVIKARTEKTDRAKIGELTYSKMGSPYRWGAKGPKRFDCSGLVYWVYQNADITPKAEVPMTNCAGMYSALREYKIGSSIKSLDKAKMGDIIFFKYGGRISHVGIYYKDGDMIHAANPKKDVCIEKVSDYNKWGYKVVGIVSVL